MTVDAGTEATETTGTETPPEAQPQAGISDQVLSRIGELGGQLTELQSRLPAPPEPEQPGLEDTLLSQFRELGYDVGDEPQGEAETAQDESIAPRDFVQLMSKAVQEAVRNEVGPYVQQQTQRDLDNAFNELEARYPQFSDDQWVQKVQGVGQDLAQSAAKFGGGTPQDQLARANALLDNPVFFELVHKSLLTDERAAQETPVEASNEGLERPGGPPPLSSETEDDLAQRIVGAGSSAKVREAFS